MHRASNSSHYSHRCRPWLTLTGLLLAVLIGWTLTRFRPSPTAVVELPVVARANLLFSEGHWYQLPASNAFTGWTVEYYPDGMLRSRAAVSNGLLHGLVEGWYTNGQMQIQELYQDSVSDGLRRKWFQNGQLQSEATIVQGKLEGNFRSWHENGQLAEQIEMHQGQPDGEAWAFYDSGFVKAETRVKSGIVLAQKTWKDGERQRGALAKDNLSGSRENGPW
jgi:hypothetical protein